MKVAVIEILDRDGTARRVVPVAQWPVTIGRAVDCDVVLDDPHIAAHHATIADTDGVLSIAVGETVNGASWPGTHLAAGQAANLAPAQIVHMGGTRLRIRRAADTLAAEERLVPEPAASRIPVAALVAALSLWVLGMHWVSVNPGGRVIDYLAVLLPLWLLLAMWCGVWAVGSKIFRHRFEFWPHVRIAVGYILISNVVELVLPGFAALSGWTFFSRISELVSVGVVCAMLVAHVARLLPTRRRFVSITIGTLYAAGVALFLTHTYQTQDSLFPERYVATLPPPVLRLASPVTTATFIDEARRLKDSLAAHINDDDPEEEAFYLSDRDLVPREPGAGGGAELVRELVSAVESHDVVRNATRGQERHVRIDPLAVPHVTPPAADERRRERD